MTLRRLGGGLLGAVLLLTSVSGCTRRVPPVDDNPAPVPEPTATTTVYVAERIRTLDPAKPQVQALAVKDGKVLATGTKDEVLAAAGKDARVVDLGSATVVPGLTDAHGHLAGLGRGLVTVDLQGVDTKEEALERLASAPSSAFQGEWLLGRGWDQNDWPEKAFPSRADLDKRFPLRPVALSRVDGHALWVNGEALRRAGITRDTKDRRAGASSGVRAESPPASWWTTPWSWWSPCCRPPRTRSTRRS